MFLRGGDASAIVFLLFYFHFHAFRPCARVSFRSFSNRPKGFASSDLAKGARASGGGAHCDGRVTPRPHVGDFDPRVHARVPRSQEATHTRLERADALGASPLRAGDASPARRRFPRGASFDPAAGRLIGADRRGLARARRPSRVRRRARRARHHHPVAPGRLLRAAVRGQKTGTPLPPSLFSRRVRGSARGPARARGADARELGGVPGVPGDATGTRAGVSRPGGLRLPSHEVRRRRRRRGKKKRRASVTVQM